jgi:hypothetical protein
LVGARDPRIQFPGPGAKARVTAVLSPLHNPIWSCGGARFFTVSAILNAYPHEAVNP